MDLVAEIVADKAAGTRRLVSEYGNRLYVTAIRLCGNEADAQDYAFREYEAWSVEQDFPIPPVFGGKSTPSEYNPRKRALLNAIKGIRPAS